MFVVVKVKVFFIVATQFLVRFGERNRWDVAQPKYGGVVEHMFFGRNVGEKTLGDHFLGEG